MPEKEQTLHMDVVYRQKKVKVHLQFQDEQSDKNAQPFYDSLKKLYLEKAESALWFPGSGRCDIRYKRRIEERKKHGG